MSIRGPFTPIGQERAILVGDVFWHALGVGTADSELQAPGAASKLLGRFLARARIEHPSARLVPHAKYPERYAFATEPA